MEGHWKFLEGGGLLREEKLNYKTRWAPDKTVAMDDF